MNKLAAIVAIGVGLGAVAGVYWFRTERLTATDIAEVAAVQKRVEDIRPGDPGEKPAAPAQEEIQFDSRGRPKKSPAEIRAQAKKQLETQLASARGESAADLPPGVTIIANESMPDKTPDRFTVYFETTKGPFAVEFTRDWAPTGADRMYELVLKKFFTDMRVFRVVENFVVQFGISGDPDVSKQWKKSNIADDPPAQSNTEGMFTFAAGGAPNTRSTQVFINLGNNSRLDRMGFAPVGKVIFGMDVVKSLYAGYGESITNLQDTIAAAGNGFLDKEFPKLDSIKRAVFVEQIKDLNAVEQHMRDERLKQLEDVAEGKTARGTSERAPGTFTAKFECTMGTFVVECTREWSPNGADRFYTLVKNGFYNGAKFFRVVRGFIVQFGLPAEADIRGTWITSTFPDDPFTIGNTVGTVSFAKPPAAENARATQVFINFGDNSAGLDPQKFTPFGKVVEGMDVVNAINSEYGESPDQARVRAKGNAYLEEFFPRLDGIKSAAIIDEAPKALQPATQGTTPANAP